MKIRFSTFIFLVLACSCVDPYFQSTTFQSVIVVQGMITDQPGPYIITLSTAIPIQNQEEGNYALTGASVKITDSNGYSENLVEGSAGVFYTQNIQGAVGTSYSITITTSDGSVYQSTDEKMLPVNDFSLQTEFKQTEAYDANQQLTSTNGFNVSVETEFLEEQQGRVWWRATGTYHILTVPSSRTKLSNARPPAQPTLVPDIPPCAGNEFTPCSCCDCWVTEYSQTPLITDNQIYAQVNDFDLWFIEVNRRTMYDKYYLQVEQLSLSAEVYEFWKNVKLQKSNSSNLFQIPPPKTSGNISALSANAKPVIGYFAASSSKKHDLTITKNDVPYKVYDIDLIPQSCLDVYRFVPVLDNVNQITITNKKPLLW